MNKKRMIIFAVDLGMITGSKKGTYFQFGLNMMKMAKQYGFDLQVYNSRGPVENVYAVYNRPKTPTPDTSLNDAKPMEQTLAQEIPTAVPKPRNPAPQNIGLGYTPDPSFPGYKTSEPNEPVKGKNYNNFPDPRTGPQPDAIIDWFIDKKNIKSQE